MGRVKGGLFTTLLDVNKRFPLDSRMLVTKREDLINPTVWKTNTLTTEATYNGMIVAVNSDGIYNGVYYLTDRKAITAENYSEYKAALASNENVEQYFSMWTKLGTLEEIEAELNDVKEQISLVGNLTPVDGTILITNNDKGKSIGVAIAPDVNNALRAVEGGLFVPTAVVPEYALEKQEVAESGYLASYRLKKTVGDDVSYVGDAINISKDMMLQNVTLETVIEANVPYAGAIVGDPYIKMVFNDANASNIYVPVKGLVDVYTAGTGIKIENNQISVKLADNTHGLVAVNGELSLSLATKETDGAMSKEDKRILDAIPLVYVAKKYEISHKPEGVLVDYREKEIRVMCPNDTEWTLQNSGENADANVYYIGFKAYAPNDAVSFKEDLAEIISDDTMYYFEDNNFAGIDAQGRHYSIVWLPVARFDGNDWTYYGANSSESKYIGWYYTVEWFDKNQIKISSDTIRINLSNEECHTNIKPYDAANYATSQDVENLKDAVSDLKDDFTWGSW